MNRFLLLMGAITTTAFLFVGVASAQVSNNFWKLNSLVLSPVNSSWGLSVPGLATSTTGCLSVSATGWISADGSACGTGVGGIGDPFTHPAAGQSATTSLMLFNGAASSTLFSSTLGYFGGSATSSFASDGQLNSQNIVVASAKTLQFAGYSALPQIYAGDPTTGIHFDAPGVLSFHGTGSYEGILTSTMRWGFGPTTTPYAKFSIHAYPSESNTTLFAVASSTASATTTLFTISNTGTTTIANGVSITAGCFSDAGGCLTHSGGGTVTNIATTFPILGGPITTTGTLTFGGLSTSTAAVVGNIPYFSGVNTFANVATSTLTAGTGLTGSFDHIGTGGSLALSVPVSLVNGGTATTTWYNNGLVFGGTTLTQATHTGNDILDWSSSKLGIGTTTPWGMLSINPNGIGTGPAFAIGSTTKTVFQVDNGGTVSNTDKTTGYAGQLNPLRSLVLQTGTTTTWTATTSAPYTPFMVMPFAGTIRDISCLTDGSFLGVAPLINTTATAPAYFIASTTAGTVAFTSANTFTAGQKISINAGTTTTATTLSISCTLRVTQTP